MHVSVFLYFYILKIDNKYFKFCFFLSFLSIKSCYESQYARTKSYKYNRITSDRAFDERWCRVYSLHKADSIHGQVSLVILNTEKWLFIYRESFYQFIHSLLINSWKIYQKFREFSRRQSQARISGQWPWPVFANGLEYTFFKTVIKNFLNLF